VEWIPPATRTGAGESAPARCSGPGTTPKRGNDSNSWIEGPRIESETLGKRLMGIGSTSCKPTLYRSPQLAPTPNLTRSRAWKKTPGQCFRVARPHSRKRVRATRLPLLRTDEASFSLPSNDRRIDLPREEIMPPPVMIVAQDSRRFSSTQGTDAPIGRGCAMRGAALLAMDGRLLRARGTRCRRPQRRQGRARRVGRCPG
jgi:hypothetical protein